MPSPTPGGFDFIVSKAATQSDTDDITDGVVVGFHVQGTSGDVKVTYADIGSDGTEVDDTLYVLQGEFVKAPIKRIWSNGTTATNIKVLYSKLRTRVMAE